MSTLHVNLIGRFGNQMFQYAYARAYAESINHRLVTNRWVGEQIFDLRYAGPQEGELNPTAELKTQYHQDQASLIYTRKQVKEWFRFKPEIEKILSDNVGVFPLVCHRRIGDYEKLGYVVVSEQSYRDAIKELLPSDNQFIHWAGEEGAFIIDGLPEFLPDFYLMAKRTSVLFRGNSTFSWWAATLGSDKVYSPVIEGLEGGREQDCKFVEGNWPRFANLLFTTDLHLEEG